MIDKLLQELFDKQIIKTWSSGGTYSAHLIDKEYRVVVEQIVRQHFLDNRDERLGILEAKVFMYEQLISKSNFSPMLETKSNLCI